MTELLVARKTSFWRYEFAISADDVEIASWTSGGWERRVPFQVDGAWYAVVTHKMGRDCELHDEPGNTVATLAGVGKKVWTLENGPRTIRIERASVWGNAFAAFEGDRSIGGVRRTGTWRADAVAELPGLDRPVQLFVLMVFLQLMARADASTAAAASG
jgi:hypothetical protein